MSRSLRPQVKSPPDRRDLGVRAQLRDVKERVRAERDRKRGVPLLPVHALPIVVTDGGRYVRYPASPDDLRRLLARLPTGIADGLTRVELLPADDRERRDETVDPFVRRLTIETAPGIWSSFVLGWYGLDTRVIRLFGYVYDPERPDRGIVDLYFRLRMLTTFVHELAHHQDLTTRWGRRQWRRDDRQRDEVYARDLEHAWTQDFVVPYLRETYPDEVASLGRWIETHGGKSVSLSVLAGDPRYELLLNGDLAFESLLQAVAKGGSAPDTHVSFADDLRYCGRVDDALEIVGNVLRDHPRHHAALLLHGRLLLEDGRLDEAAAIAEAASAWELVSEIAFARSDWEGALAAGVRVHQGPVLSNARAWRVRETMVRALLELERFDEVEQSLVWLRGWDALRRSRPKELEMLECLVLLRRGACEEALARATTLLESGGTFFVVRATRFEAACRLGRSPDPLDQETKDGLRRLGYGAWVDRISE
jgi:hypothetical protein